MQQSVEALVPNGAGGYVRKSLMQAVAANKAGTSGNAGVPAEEAAEGVSTDNEVGEQGALPAGVTPDQVAAAQQAAASGDQASIDWLKALGITAGVAGAGAGAYALMKAMGNRKKPAATVAASTLPNQSTAVAKYKPTVTQLRDEEIIPNGGGRNPALAGQQPQGKLTQAPGNLPTPQDMQALMAPGPNYPVGPTKRQMEEDVAYAQRDINNNKPKTKLKAAVAARKSDRMAKAAAAFRKIR